MAVQAPTFWMIFLPFLNFSIFFVVRFPYRHSMRPHSINYIWQQSDGERRSWQSFDEAMRMPPLYYYFFIYLLLSNDVHTLNTPNRTNTLYYVCTSSHFVSIFIFHLLILRYKYLCRYIQSAYTSHWCRGVTRPTVETNRVIEIQFSNCYGSKRDREMYRTAHRCRWTFSHSNEIA